MRRIPSYPFRLSAPGNLLLAGEYAILEPGGLGVGAAVDVRLIGTLQEASSTQIESIWPGVHLTWSPQSHAGEFVGTLYEALGLHDPGVPPFHLTLDSSAFFTQDGRKLGLGSSAALAVVLTAVAYLLKESWNDSAVPAPRLFQSELFKTKLTQQAILAHRTAQGGKGSGYDVAASCWGGLGLFTGGRTPSWTPASWSLPPFRLFSGPDAVRTVSAIGAYQAWKTAQPHQAQEFLRQSNSAVKHFFSAKTWSERRLAWEDAKQLSLSLGRQIGVSAELESTFPPSYFVKALGAGNESGLVVQDEGNHANNHPQDQDSGARAQTFPLQLAEDGVRLD